LLFVGAAPDLEVLPKSMWAIFTSWIAVGIVVPVLIGIGVGVMSMNPPDFLVARVAFSIAALILIARVAWWIGAELPRNTSRMNAAIFAFIIFGAIGALWISSLGWVNQRRSLALTKDEPAKPPTVMSVPTTPNPTAQSPLHELPEHPHKHPKPEEPKAKSEKPPTLSDLFKSSFPNTLRVDGNEWALMKEGIKITSGPTKVYLDFEAKAKFIAFYVPHSYLSYTAATGLWQQVQEAFSAIEKSVGVTSGYGANPTDLKELTFSGRVFIFHEDRFDLRQLADLVDLYKAHGMALDFRGPDYLADQVIAWYHQHGAKEAH